MKRHPSRLIKTPLDELTYQIIGCAMAVHGRRGPGFREATYQADMEVHLKDKGLAVTGCKVGLLINFGKGKLQYRRILPPQSVEEHRLNRQWLWVLEWLRHQHADAGMSIESDVSTDSISTVPSVPPVPPVSSDPLSATGPFHRRPCLTQAEYLSVALSTNRIVEWSDGELIEHPFGTTTHQLALGVLLSSLAKYVGGHKLGTVLMAAYAVKLWDGKFRSPDVLFIPIANQIYIQEEYCEHPGLVIEVVSRFTHDLDYMIKRREYALARIPEYWIVDPNAKIVTVLKLSDNAYETHGEFSAGAIAESALLPGFCVNVNDIWRATNGYG